MKVLGIDIGGTGIKGAPVDVATGRLTAPRYRLLTPRPAKPKPVAEVVAEVAAHFCWRGPLGITLPSVVKDGVVMTAANIDRSWIGTDARALFAETAGLRATVLNDADAAGIAEMTFGAGKGRRGVVVLLTLGTGIGSAVFLDGKLLPNTEIGHLEVKGKDAEERASDRARREKKWKWKEWSKHVEDYLEHVEALLWPDLFIIGGGVSKKHEKFLPRIRTRTPVVPAKTLNEAGIVGAALAARAEVPRRKR
ncbi:MAG: ROK family protein [Planctomycetes bacterium]|nr:ROK family protein [Planctomycetota bacterium]